MTTFTPQQGDYFEVKDLTQSKYNDICLNYGMEPHPFSPNTSETPFIVYEEEGHYFAHSSHPVKFGRLLTYQDVFSEEKKVIDWNKPIETSNGGDAFVNSVNSDGAALVTYWDENLHRYDVMRVAKDTLALRNKPELIKPQGWVIIYTERSVIDWYPDNPGTLRTHDKHVIVSMEDLMSGKFKDGIPKGYVSS